jgi:hypothetical protein
MTPKPGLVAGGRAITIFLPTLGRNGPGPGAERIAITVEGEFVEAGHRFNLGLSITHPSSAKVDPRVQIVHLECRRLWIPLRRLIVHRWREWPRKVLCLMPLASRLNVLLAWLGPPSSLTLLPKQMPS